MGPTEIAVILGATGGQGGSVIDVLVDEGDYQIRGVTRDITSEKAKALRARGVDMVVGDANDESSLLEAFVGASVIFAVTDFFPLMMTMSVDEAEKAEFKHGQNIAKAASKIPTLKHFIWSTLPSASEISSKRHRVAHMEGKAATDDFIKRELPSLATKTTFLWVGFYASSYLYPPIAPIYNPAADKYICLQPVKPTTATYSAGDMKNIGTFVSAILAKPDLTTPARYVMVETGSVTNEEALKLLTASTGKEATFVQTSMDDYVALFGSWGKLLGGMLKFWEECGRFAWLKHGLSPLTRADLGIDPGRLISVEESLKAMKWTSEN